MYDTAGADLHAGNLEGVRGITAKSTLKTLESFHPSHPGLPPCLGHDTLQGVLSYNSRIVPEEHSKK